MAEPMTFRLEELGLESGGVLKSAQLVYTTHGRFDTTGRGNAILFPTAFAGSHTENEWLIGPGRPLCTERYFVIVPNLLGGGISSSPSNHLEQPGAQFPRLSISDNVQIQTQLLNHLGVEELALVVGYSMGGLQAYQWAVQHPERVNRLATICASARTSEWQMVFIQGLEAVLGAASALDATDSEVALSAVGRVWAAWGMSAEFYDLKLYQSLDFATAADYIASNWVDRLTRLDPLDIAAMLNTWKAHDVGRGRGGVEEALSSIRCPAVLITSQSDTYFRSAYAAREATLIPRARHVDLQSPWGHVAGKGLDLRDAEQIEETLCELLSRS